MQEPGKDGPVGGAGRRRRGIALALLAVLGAGAWFALAGTPDESVSLGPIVIHGSGLRAVVMVVLAGFAARILLLPERRIE